MLRGHNCRELIKCSVPYNCIGENCSNLEKHKVFLSVLVVMSVRSFSIGVVLELRAIALQRPRIGIGIVLMFLKVPELVLEFYCS
jgi:hypothetical protein